MRNILKLSILLILLTGFMACGSDTSVTDPVVETEVNPLIGTWRLLQFEFKSESTMPEHLGAGANIIPADSTSYHITFAEDNTYTTSERLHAISLFIQDPDVPVEAFYIVGSAEGTYTFDAQTILPSDALLKMEVNGAIESMSNPLYYEINPDGNLVFREVTQTILDGTVETEITEGNFVFMRVF